MKKIAQNKHIQQKATGVKMMWQTPVWTPHLVIYLSSQEYPTFNVSSRHISPEAMDSIYSQVGPRTSYNFATIVTSRPTLQF